MVVANPLFVGRWTAKKFKATVVNDIWPEVLFFTLVATMVALVSKKTNADLGVSNQLLTVLGTVLGLVISFRTSTAYERYSDGRKMWSTIGLASRNIAQMIWIHVPSERVEKSIDPETKEQRETKLPTLPAVIEKKTMVNLVQAFSVAVKHMLRSESGIYYEDLYPLVCFLPKHAYKHTGTTDLLPLWESSKSSSTLVGAKGSQQRASTMPDPSTTTGHYSETPAKPRYRKEIRENTFDPERLLPMIDSEHPLRPARCPPKTSFLEYLPIFRPFKLLSRAFRRKARAGLKASDSADEEKAPLSPSVATPYHHHFHNKANAQPTDSNVPLEVALYLSSYLAWLLKNNYLAPPIATAMTNNIILLQDAVFSLDRIRSTPLPFAYQAHLRMSLWIYLMLLPFQIYDAFGYLCIPATTFASFLLVGFLEIGQEIENPFNYDLNDLDLDQFCLTIQRELHEITAHPSSSPNEYIFTDRNQPFAPEDRTTAEKITSDMEHEYYGEDTGMDSIRRTLLRSWRSVDAGTREHH